LRERGPTDVGGCQQRRIGRGPSHCVRSVDGIGYTPRRESALYVNGVTRCVCLTPRRSDAGMEFHPFAEAAAFVWAVGSFVSLVWFAPRSASHLGPTTCRPPTCS
jgi:hypothetical protein